MEDLAVVLEFVELFFNDSTPGHCISFPLMIEVFDFD
jgi:hypothetical protein